jgi:hypothetical protein
MTENTISMPQEIGQSVPSQPKTQRQAMKIVNKYVLLSGGIELIPARPKR